MYDITHAEISPGSIQTATCNTCNNDALTFDVVALGNTGVAYMGTITRCGTCEERGQRG